MTWEWPQVVKLILFAAVVLAAIAMFAVVVLRRVEYMKLGVKSSFERYRAERRKGFGREVLGHRKLLQDARSGVMHLVYFYGFIMLQFGAIDLIWKGLSDGKPLPFPFYAAFSLIQEITVALVFAAVLYAAYRRYGERLQRLQKGWKPSLVLWFIGVLMLTVIGTLTFERLAAGSESHISGGWTPISYELSKLLLLIGLQEQSMMAQVGLELFWWLHLFVLLSFLVYVPQSKHFHLLTAPVNLWFRRNKPPGQLTPLNLEDEEAESFGTGKIEHLSQKQMLDLYACVECGRCTNVCPAANTGKLLSPMHLMIKLRDHLTEKGAAITSKSPWLPAGLWQSKERLKGHAHVMGAMSPSWSEADPINTSIAGTMALQASTWQKQEGVGAEGLELIGDVMTEEELWACTTCRNCEEQCPVGNEHVDKIIDMRRHLVLMEGKLPSDGQRTLQNIERQSNPWGLPRAERAAWIEECERQTGIRVVTMQELKRQGRKADVLLWAGSMDAYDMRSRKVLFDLVALLTAAQVNFATLGSEERNSGDTARRIGNELLFQELCRENIETLQKYGTQHIVTACPHTYNTFKNEYPDFGLSAAIQIEHHTELLDRLLREGALQPRFTVEERVTVHDSCYLGRYNDVYDPPRSLLRAIPGVKIEEMKRSGSNAMCCGAGGGLMWMEDQGGARVNVARTAQALEVKPSVISSACPYCLTMMEDGLKSLSADTSVRARDVAELLADSVLGRNQEDQLIASIDPNGDQKK